jgi:hypothetical protein
MNPHNPDVRNEMPPQAQEAFDRANREMRKRLAEQAAETQQQSESPTFTENIMNIHIPQNAAATSNAIDSGLQRTAILQDAVKEFAKVIAPLRSFATVFESVPLQGTDTIKVPYYPLPTSANSSYDFTQDGGYVFGQATNTSAKEITVDRRAYQPLDFSSQEMARQPQLRVSELVKLAAAQLAYNVVQDVLSCITAANFGAAGLVRAAAAITTDDLADLAGGCNDLNWPISGRSLIMGTAFDTQLKKDPAIKLALNINGTEVARQGMVPNLAGFDYYTCPNLPTNNEALGGFAVGPGAIAFASAPVAPGAGVRGVLSAYQVVTDPMTGLALTLREWGNPDLDRNYTVIECAYGFAPINANALRRITFA